MPIVIGQTRDERTQSVFGARDNVGRPVTPTDYTEEIHRRYGTHGDAVLRAYPLEGFWSPTVALASVEGDERSCVRRTLIGQFAVATPTYAYEFDEQDPPSFVSIWRLNTTFRFGATHVNDLGYIFDYLHQALPFSSAQMELSDQMIRYWSEFTWNGDPNAHSIPDWPRYDPAEGGMLSLRASGTAVKTDFAVDHKCAFWASISGPPTG